MAGVHRMRIIAMHESQLYWRMSAVSWQRLVESSANGHKHVKALTLAQEQIEFWEEQIQEAILGERKIK